METVSVVAVLTLGFAFANLGFQMGAARFVRRIDSPLLPGRAVVLEHPMHSRIDGMPRVRANRHDMQLGIGHDFAAPDAQDQVWPREPRISHDRERGIDVSSELPSARDNNRVEP
jgi:hypothetical protein